jgi:acetyltransferase-like isoleucine patch superfamily enzyme
MPSILWRLEAQLKGIQFQGTADILGRPMLSRVKGSQIVIGEGVKIFSSTRGNPLGLARPCALRTMAEGATIKLHKNVGLSGVALCAGTSIEIGEGTIVGAGAMIIDNDFHQPIDECGWSDDSKTGARPIKVGRGVFIGANAIILKGVTIGDRAVIGAGAVVTRDVPAGHVAVGNPAVNRPPRNRNATLT